MTGSLYKNIFRNLNAHKNFRDLDVLFKYLYKLGVHDFKIEDLPILKEYLRSLYGMLDDIYLDRWDINLIPRSILLGNTIMLLGVDIEFTIYFEKLVITVSTDANQQHTIRDCFYSFKLLLVDTTNSVFRAYPSSPHLSRTTFTDKEAVVGYIHSHVSTGNYSNSSNLSKNNICLGSSGVIREITESLIEDSFNYDQLYYYLLMIETLLSVESSVGGAYCSMLKLNISLSEGTTHLRDSDIDNFKKKLTTLIEIRGMKELACIHNLRFNYTNSLPNIIPNEAFEFFFIQYLGVTGNMNLIKNLWTRGKISPESGEVYLVKIGNNLDTVQNYKLSKKQKNEGIYFRQTYYPNKLIRNDHRNKQKLTSKFIHPKILNNAAKLFTGYLQNRIVQSRTEEIKNRTVHFKNYKKENQTPVPDNI